MIVRILAISVILAVAGLPARAQNSLFQREVLNVQLVPVSSEYGGSSPTVSMIATEKPKPTTFSKHDLITIIVREDASQSTSSNAQTSRDSAIDAKIQQFPTIDPSSHQYIRPNQFTQGDPAIKAELKRDFTGTGQTSRQDTLIARIQAEVIEVKPNGNLLIQASKLVKTDEESYTMTLTGSCRAKDITPDNTILSTQISELEITKESKGTSKDATKRSWLQKFFDCINIL